MKDRILNILALTIVTIGAWYLVVLYPNDIVQNVFDTSLSFLVIYIILKIFLSEFIGQRIKDYRLGYSFRKVINVLFAIILAAVFIRIWVEDPQALLVSYGLVAAGVAIALQDFFKNFLGGVVVMLNSLYRVGDRVEIAGTKGDVIDVGILYTTLLEIQEWVEGDQSTGRVTHVPNGFVLSKNMYNYTEDHGFIWDEICIPVTYSSDWMLARDMMKKVTTIQTQKVVDAARKDLKKLRKKYYVKERTLEPQVYVRATDNWIGLTVRYVCEVTQRRETNNVLMQSILHEWGTSRKIHIASSTLGIVDMPPLKIKGLK